MGNMPTTSKSAHPSGATGQQLPLDTIHDASWLEAIDKAFIFVWCDPSIGKKTNVDDDTNTIRRLINIVHKVRQIVHTFNDMEACREFIKDVQNVCLITSGQMGEVLVPTIHDCEQMHSIYIFCANKARHEVWAAKYPKIMGVHTDIMKICGFLNSYIASQLVVNCDQLEFDIIPSGTNPSPGGQQDKLLTYMRLASSILLMDPSVYDIPTLIRYCRSEYTTDYSMQLINDFDQNYRRSKAIAWFTKSYFFRGIVNRALRSHDLYTLCCMHRFVKDIHIQLTKLHQNQRDASRELLTLYFGEFVSKNDFDRLRTKAGQLISFHQFLLANPEQAIVVSFLQQENSAVASGNRIPVLFHVHIDPSVEYNTVYANIGPMSQFVHEKEYLISMFSTYRLDKIEKRVDAPTIWSIHLTLTNASNLPYDNHQPAIEGKHFDTIAKSQKLYTTVKNKLDPFESTHKLFRTCLNNDKNLCRLMMLHYNLGVIYESMDAFEMALEEYQFAVNTARRFIPTCVNRDDVCLVPFYSRMGLCHQGLHKFTDAFDDAARALRIITQHSKKSKWTEEFESSCYFTLGLIHEQAKQYSHAQQFYERALSIRQRSLPLIDLDKPVSQEL